MAPRKKPKPVATERPSGTLFQQLKRAEWIGYAERMLGYPEPPKGNKYGDADLNEAYANGRIKADDECRAILTRKQNQFCVCKEEKAK